MENVSKSNQQRSDDAGKQVCLRSEIRKQMEKETAIWGDCHLCYTCDHCLEASIEVGYLARTTQDFNDCPYAADIMYNDGEVYGIKRVVETRQAAGEMERVTVFDNSSDNGMGYWITRCPFYAPIRGMTETSYDKVMRKMLEYTESLIKMGVSPDTAADNAGYNLYAALGGQARQTPDDRRQRNKNNPDFYDRDAYQEPEHFWDNFLGKAKSR